MVDLASKLVDMVDIADWALFGKNGGDATSLAVMIAREFTGKKKIIKMDHLVILMMKLEELMIQ